MNAGPIGRQRPLPPSRRPAAGAAYAPLVPRPSKVVCVGLNYRTHIQEMGRDLPKYPTLFAKFADALIGARDDIVRPAETGQFDWEAELAVIIGSSALHARGAAAERAIGGFTILNDVTCRDWQFRTREWLQGKTWDSSTPVGPFLVTPDELPGGVRPALGGRLLVDGEVMQSDSTADLRPDGLAAPLRRRTRGGHGPPQRPAVASENQPIPFSIFLLFLHRSRQEGNRLREPCAPTATRTRDLPLRRR
jgi:2-keto-4-pentenoate hydratase/2-oxohepta-3-ene-1,7-dioic acid hydratase in catechol pathway